MNKREEQKKHTRQRLLIAAATCFAEKGYSGCSVADIATRAGVSQGNLYVHFKNKEHLFQAMIEEEHQQGAQKAKQAANSTHFLQGIITLMTDCIRDVGFPIDHRLWTEILAVCARDESIRQTFVSSDQAMREVFIDLLKKAANAGEIDHSLDFNSVSIWLYALIDGLIARTANDTNFEFQQHLNVFETLVKRALKP
ncbi:TetR/AcrR family transcriptional regulator [Neisseria sp. Ec49-e6-T10]|uniref:TetR/AcrR family transcriptional regulator n=1 Tax=Neisseria sp. Ec49-e6-T10 TaxID=3140744 RepID=UPI003EBD6EA0